MSAWDWLTKPDAPYRWRFLIGIAIKSLILIVVINLVFALLDPMAFIGRLTVYNWLVPGRQRLPYGENPEQSYNLSLQNLDALFASHVINGTPKAADEFRVLLIGDSSVWGVLLDPAQTLTGVINTARLRTTSGKGIRAYNLGYPVQSLTKDLLILQYATRYQPDLIVWLFTPEAFAPDVQLSTQIVRENADQIRGLIAKHNLNIQVGDSAFIETTFLDKTIIGRRRQLADWLRLQLYGLTWSATRIDQRYPRFFEPRREDFDTNVTWHGFEPGTLKASDLAFDVLKAGIAEAGRLPVVLVNEPMFISKGKNSDLRYNFFYPRWLADTFREQMTAQIKANHWLYLDLWDRIAPEEFTDSAVHLTPEGSRTLASGLGAAILQIANGNVTVRR